jgi:hypothetical protein
MLSLSLMARPATAQDCGAVRQVVANAATGFVALRDAQTRFTGRQLWRSRVNLPHTGACIVDPAGGFRGSAATFHCSSADVAQLDALLSACLPGTRDGRAGDPDGDLIEFRLGGVSLTLDRAGRTLRILAF